MAKKTFRISVLFKLDRFGHSHLSGFLDMLRYDNATVESWDIDKDEIVEVTLNKIGSDFTRERWHSFGINIADLLPRTW